VTGPALGTLANTGPTIYEEGGMTIRVVIVEDSPTMRAILTNRLSREPDIEVVAAAANAAEGRR
jgi:hypothetical protein